MSTFAERLRSARKMRGWSLQELADKIDNKVSRQALHKYELGDFSPEPAILIAICEAIDLRPEYFSRKAMPAFEKISFRKLQKLTKREQEKAVEQTRNELFHYLELEKILGSAAVFELVLLDKKIAGRGQAIELADLVREKWSLGNDPIPSVVGLLEAIGIRVIEFEAHDDFSGMSTFVGAERSPTIVVNRSLDLKLDRKRFTLCHELGHLLMDEQFDPTLNEKERERLCDAFACALLLPGERLKMALGEHRSAIHLSELILIKQLFGASIRAVLYRAKDCGIVTDYFLNHCLIGLSKSFGRKNEPGRFEGFEQPARFRQMLLRALSEEIITMARGAELSGKKLADLRDDLEAI